MIIFYSGEKSIFMNIETSQEIVDDFVSIKHDIGIDLN
jgi:hypothetical protein